MKILHPWKKPCSLVPDTADVFMKKSSLSQFDNGLFFWLMEKPMMKFLSLSLLSLLWFRPAVAQQAIALVNAKVVTVDKRHPVAEVVIIKGRQIEQVGTVANTPVPAGAKVIDCGGRLVLPGLIDGHAHLESLGRSLSQLSVTGTTSEAELLKMVRERAANTSPGEWILGGRWDQNDWPVRDFPTYESLTEAAPNNPVYLVRVDGHAGWANQRAMKLAGVTAATTAPAGGAIHRMPGSNEPSGIFIDRAQSLIRKVIPEPSEAQKRRHLRTAVDACLKVGLTGIHDAGISPASIARYKALIDAGDLTFRAYGMVSVPESLHGEAIDEFLRKHRIVGYGADQLTVRSIKLMGDGALGSRGAALIEPYSDDADTRGLLITGRERITEVAAAALRTGYQVNTHAIGDRSNLETLDGYTDALRRHPVADHRFRIEHAQILQPDDIPRFARLGVLPSMQPTHATSDMPWAEDRVGPQRIRTAYAWRNFAEQGLPIIGGSDFPVEHHNPLLGFYAAITRQDGQGLPKGGWYSEQLLTRMEALRAMTIDAAWGAFEEGLKGSITPGKLADLVILDRDIMTVPFVDILDTEVLMTLIEGDVVYQSPNWK
jgi:predicted amidohydrolase YtcJ